MDLTDALSTLPPSAWLADRVIVFDWYDGPREGVARMAVPRCEFAFELLEERYNPEGLDDRYFGVFELPRGSVEGILATVRSLGNPASPVWVPVWTFGTREEKLLAEMEIERALGRKRDTGLVIHSRDMTEFLGCWRRDLPNGQWREGRPALEAVGGG